MSIWRPVPEFENLYEVSSSGEVRSLCKRYRNEIRLLKQGVGSKGYLNVTLCAGGKQKTVNVHRLVASVFLPNPDNLPCVNHKDENKTNNKVENLEWCSYYYNNTYGERLTKSALKRGIPVICIETGVKYPSAYAAHRMTGITQSKICLCCHGKAKTAGGYHWAFIDHPFYTR